MGDVSEDPSFRRGYLEIVCRETRTELDADRDTIQQLTARNGDETMPELSASPT